MVIVYLTLEKEFTFMISQPEATDLVVKCKHLWIRHRGKQLLKSSWKHVPVTPKAIKNKSPCDHVILKANTPFYFKLLNILAYLVSDAVQRGR